MGRNDLDKFMNLKGKANTFYYLKIVSANRVRKATGHRMGKDTCSPGGHQTSHIQGSGGAIAQ